MSIKHILLQRYHRVIWVIPDRVTPNHRYAGFSHEWDLATIPLKEKSDVIQKILNESVKIRRDTYAPACEICFFFDADDFLHSLLPKTAKSVLFLDHREWDEGNIKDFAKKCTHILTPSRYTAKDTRHPTLIHESSLCPFDSAAQLIPKVNLVPGQEATLFYPAYDMTFAERRCIQQIADIVKECCPNSGSCFRL